MSHEGLERQPTEGEQWLAQLGLEGMADQQFMFEGTMMRVGDFHELCGDEVRPMMKALANLSPDDPRKAQFVDIARTRLQHYLGGSGDGRS